jgi:hypothetical protein
MTSQWIIFTLYTNPIAMKKTLINYLNCPFEGLLIFKYKELLIEDLNALLKLNLRIESMPAGVEKFSKFIVDTTFSKILHLSCKDDIFAEVLNDSYDSCYNYATNYLFNILINYYQFKELLQDKYSPFYFDSCTDSIDICSSDISPKLLEKIEQMNPNLEAEKVEYEFYPHPLNGIHLRVIRSPYVRECPDDFEAQYQIDYEHYLRKGVLIKVATQEDNTRTILACYDGNEVIDALIRHNTFEPKQYFPRLGIDASFFDKMQDQNQYLSMSFICTCGEIGCFHRILWYRKSGNQFSIPFVIEKYSEMIIKFSDLLKQNEQIDYWNSYAYFEEQEKRIQQGLNPKSIDEPELYYDSSYKYYPHLFLDPNFKFEEFYMLPIEQ